MAHVIPNVPGFTRSATHGGSVQFLRADGDVTVTVTALGRTAPYGCWSADWRGVDTLTLDNMADDGHETAMACRQAIDEACEALRVALGAWPEDWAPFVLA